MLAIAERQDLRRVPETAQEGVDVLGVHLIEPIL